MLTASRCVAIRWVRTRGSRMRNFRMAFSGVWQELHAAPTSSRNPVVARRESPSWRHFG
jgi:hypothetical protein